MSFSWKLDEMIKLSSTWFYSFSFLVRNTFLNILTGIKFLKKRKTFWRIERFTIKMFFHSFVSVWIKSPENISFIPSKWVDEYELFFISFKILVSQLSNFIWCWKHLIFFGVVKQRMTKKIVCGLWNSTDFLCHFWLSLLLCFFFFFYSEWEKEPTKYFVKNMSGLVLSQTSHSDGKKYTT